MSNVFSDEQMQKLVNIILATERWARIESMQENSKSIGLDSESAYLEQRSLAFHRFMTNEIVALSGRDSTDLYIQDMYNYMDDINEVK